MKLVGWYAILSSVAATVSLVLLIVSRSPFAEIAEAGLWSLTCGALGAGILKRMAFAWPLGMGMLGASLASYWTRVTPVVLGESEGSRWFLLTLTWVGGAFVVTWLGYLWYMHRQYFRAK